MPTYQGTTAMNTDIRISVDFFAHHKTRKLRKRIGADGVLSLIQLWTYAAKLRPDGDLDGMSEEDIELAADWSGEDGDFVKALADVGFLDFVDGHYLLHDWIENNPWAGGSDARSDTSRFSRMAYTFPNEYQTLLQAGIKGISKADYEKLKLAKNPFEIVQRIINDTSTTLERPLNDVERPLKRPLNESNERSSPAPSPVLKKNTKNSIDISGNLDRARARRGSRPVVSGADFSVLPDSPLSPPPEPRTETGNEPSLEFLELRAAYSERVRSEGEMTGFVEYRQARAARDWPGLNAILDDIDKRLTAGLFHTNYGPSLRKYLTERYWKAPIRAVAPPHAPHGRTRDAPETLTERNAATARQVLAELEAEHD